MVELDNGFFGIVLIFSGIGWLILMVILSTISLGIIAIIFVIGGGSLVLIEMASPYKKTIHS